MNSNLGFLTLLSVAGVALSLAAEPGLADKSHSAGFITVAANDKAPAPETSSDGASTGDPAGVLKPETYPETSSEVAECMKTWDPGTNMSKEEYLQSCKATLKYFPEKNY